MSIAEKVLTSNQNSKVWISNQFKRPTKLFW